MAGKPALPEGADASSMMSEVVDRAERWSSFLTKVPQRLEAIRKNQAGKISQEIRKGCTYDVVVVGFGSAGASAALEAADAGAQVLVIDASVGGGSTQRSGGVIYLGGGTQSQRDAGFVDDADNMYRCLKLDTEGAVDDERLRTFCNESVANFDWMCEKGVKFADPATGRAEFYSKKASLPPGGTTLYWSGNEEAEPWRSIATPAPRGHWPWFPGCDEPKDCISPPTRGHVLFNALDDAIRSHPNIEVRLHCRGARPVMQDGCVVGVAVSELQEWPALRSLHQMVQSVGTMSPEYDLTGNVRRECRKFSDRMFAEMATEYEIFAQAGVIVCSGGFMFNDALVEKHAKTYLGNMPLGNLGDDGSGISLGQQANGGTTLMNRCTAWKFLAPPNGFLSGVLVDTKAAKRFSNEDVYNSKLVDRQFARAGGQAWMLLDSTLFEEIRAEARDPSNNLYGFQRLLAIISLDSATKKASTWAGLARACGLPREELEATVERYNADAHLKGDTNFGKQPKYLRALETGPYYAVWIDARVSPWARKLMNALPIWSMKFARPLPMMPLLKTVFALGLSVPPTPTFTLGGLKVDMDQRVVDKDTLKPIPGLYAAGRTAAGVASGGYVSGLSIGDAVFAGRRAGRHAVTGVADPVGVSASSSQSYTHMDQPNVVATSRL